VRLTCEPQLAPLAGFSFDHRRLELYLDHYLEVDGQECMSESDLKQAAKRLGIPLWGRILIGGLVLLVGGAGSYVYRVDSKIDRLGQSFTDFQKLQQDFQEKLIFKLLDKVGSQVTGGDAAAAARTLETTEAILESAAASKLPAGPTLFSGAVDRLGKLLPADLSPEIARGVHRLRVSLVVYRSSIERPPRIPSDFHEVIHAVAARPPVVEVPASRLDCHLIPRDLDCIMFIPDARNPLAPGPLVEHLGIENAAQTLDGISWEGVVFLNSRIRYKGGEVHLHDTTFVACTFEIVDSPNGTRLANALALSEPVLALAPAGAPPLAPN